MTDSKRIYNQSISSYGSTNEIRSNSSDQESNDDTKKQQESAYSIQAIWSDEEDVNDEDRIDPSPNPFLDDEEVTKYYTALYEQSDYECRHVFEPQLLWTVAEEKRIVSKLDGKIALFSCILFAALEICRLNIRQALSDDFLDDLNLTTNDYNMGCTIFLVGFLLGEIPSSVLSKVVGVDRFVPFQIIAWSIVGMSQCFITGRKTFFLCRGLSSIFMSGLIPELVTAMSSYYKSNELSVRLSWFWTTLSCIEIFASIVSPLILKLRGTFGWEGWRFLFLIFNFSSFIIGLCSYCMLAPSPIETKSRFYPQGWFNNREVSIIVNRVLRDDPSKGDMNHRQSIEVKPLIRALLDYDLWPIYILGFIAFIPKSTIGSYLNIIMRNFGWSSSQINYFAIPHFILHIYFLLETTKISERFNQKALVALLSPMFQLPLVLLLNFWNGAMVNAWGTWAICTLIVGGPYIHAINVAWVSRNSGSIKTRAVASAMYNITVQLGSVVSANIYRQDDAPLYHRGNQQLLYLSLSVVPIILLVKAYYIWRNHTKRAHWQSMTPEEQSWYLNHTTDQGNKRLDFMFDS